MDYYYSDANLHSVFDIAQEDCFDQVSPSLNFSCHSGDLLVKNASLWQLLDASPTQIFKTDATDVTEFITTKYSEESFIIFNDNKGDSITDTTVNTTQDIEQTVEPKSADNYLNPQVLSINGSELLKDNFLLSDSSQTKEAAVPRKVNVDYFKPLSTFFSSNPLQPLQTANILNIQPQQMFGVPMLSDSKKTSHRRRRPSRITKIARPQRKHVRFYYDQKLDGRFNVVFKGGFIRQSVIKSYFPDYELDNFTLPNNWNPVTVELENDFYGSMEESINSQIKEGVSHVRTYWKMTKRMVGSKFFITIQEESLDCDPIFDDDNYYFNIITTVVESGSFGAIERGARNRDKIQRAITKDDAAANFRWCHFITSSEMKGIFDFFLADYDYCANDNSVLEKLKVGAKPDPFKHHESRIRSHMLGYISGKSCKLHATKLKDKPKLFSEQMYRLIMSFDDYKRPFNTAKDISVMEMKYMFENLSDLLEKYYWVDPSTVPEGGYPMKN